MKRFFKTLVLLLAALLLLVSGVDRALDRLNAQPTQSAFFLYNEKGETLFAYRGNLTLCERFTHPFRSPTPAFPSRPTLAPRA